MMNDLLNLYFKIVENNPSSEKSLLMTEQKDYSWSFCQLKKENSYTRGKYCY